SRSPSRATPRAMLDPGLTLRPTAALHDRTKPFQRPRMAGSAKRLKTPGNHHRLVDRHAGGLVEPALQPPRGEPRAAGAVAERDERGQVERDGEAEGAELKRRELGDDDVAGIDRAAEDRVPVALARDARALRSWGRTARRTLDARPPAWNPQ